MTKPTGDYEKLLLDILTSLGQMSHIEGKVTHSKSGDSVPYHQHGVMGMKVEVRSDLIARGWALLEGDK